MITVKSILNDERFSNLKLINSNADLDRKVSSIESTETPDISFYLTPNAFLLTTAMSYKDNQQDLCDLIMQLNNLPCAALGIKLGRFIDRLDDKVIETADRLNFPLIQIPLEMTLGNIFHKLLSFIWNNQNEQLLYSLNIQKKFSDLMIRNSSLNVLIKNLSHTLKQPIALMDPFGNIVHTSNNIKNNYSKEALRNMIENLPSKKDLSSPINIQLDEKIINPSVASIYHINMASYYPHYLVVFNAENMEYPLSTMAIEQAILILAFTLYKNLRISYNSLSIKEEFLNDLISLRTHETLSENQILFKGEKYGVVSSNSYQIIIARISNKDKSLNDTGVIEEWYTLVFNWLNEKLSKDVKDAVLFPDRGKYDYVILLQKPMDNLLDYLTSYREVLLKTLKLDINFFIGNAVQDIDSIKYSYREALESIDFGETKDNIKFIKYYNQLDVYQLLRLLPKNQIENFVLDTLKILAYPEDETIKDLRDTLKTYLDLNCNITDTANVLYIHRNTVKYRIGRCTKILGQDISDPHYSLKLRISLAYTEKG